MQQNLKRYFPSKTTPSTSKRKNDEDELGGESVSKRLKYACDSAAKEKLMKYSREPFSIVAENLQVEESGGEKMETNVYSFNLSNKLVDTEEETVGAKLTDLAASNGDSNIDRKKEVSDSSLHASGKTKYTPLEEQFISIKSCYMDAVLLIECGYKYRFFGDDAKIASTVLNIYCHMDHNFLSASIPVHRLNVHVQRLVSEGYKVGVVNQAETAALKAASSKKSGPFSRELTALYTKTTFNAESSISGEDYLQDTEESDQYMMCVFVIDKKGESTITIGFMAVQPLLGSIVFEEFTDSRQLLTGLDNRLAHVNPMEIVYPASEQNDRIRDTFANWKKHRGVAARLEELPDEWFEYTNAIQFVSDFYSKNCGSEENQSIEGLQTVLSLPHTVISCLAALIRHLTLFKLQNMFSFTQNFHPYSSSGFFLHLNSNTLSNLEIFQNQTDGRKKGSLFWVLDHTQTLFGQRLLRQWLCHPLTDTSKIKERQEAVKALLANSDGHCIYTLSDILRKTPDLEKLLCACYQYKCKPQQFVVMLRVLQSIKNKISSILEMVIKEVDSVLVAQIFKQLPDFLDTTDSFLSMINLDAARESSYEGLFTDLSKFPEIKKEKEAISKLKSNIQNYRKTIAGVIPSFSDYVTVSGIEYLVEVKNSSSVMKNVPKDWSIVSRTKNVSRFHPSYISEALLSLAQHKDKLAIKAKDAWTEFLKDFNCNYGAYKKAIDLLAVADCLLSLVEVAKLQGYICPLFIEEPTIEISRGRNPILELIMNDAQYVPNDTNLEGSGLTTMIITGPNMGGKSSYIRQVALLCIMAQVGSFIPAESAVLSTLDAVYTRMGASDHILVGRSTFMTELMETAEILRLATPRSLVVMDELGRGTSTHDGTAIAFATLFHLIDKIRCFTLFVTHYPSLSQLEVTYPKVVANFHMSYVEDDNCGEVYEKLVFLYEIVSGKAGSSYGLNVAALAGLTSDLLSVAKEKSTEIRLGTWKSLTTSSSHKLFQKLMNCNTKDCLQQIMVEQLNP